MIRVFFRVIFEKTRKKLESMLFSCSQEAVAVSEGQKKALTTLIVTIGYSEAFGYTYTIRETRNREGEECHADSAFC